MARASLASHMAAAGLDVLVAASPDNVYYSSGVAILTQRMIPSRLAFVVWAGTDDVSIIACTIEEAQVRAESWITDIHGYVEFVDSPVAVLADVIRAKGLDAGRIGIETAYLPLRYHAELIRHLPNARLVDGDEVFERARMHKSLEERALLERAAQATAHAVSETFRRAKFGDTELHLANVMENTLRAEGADGIAFTVLATGPNAGMAHPTPGGQTVERNSILRTDFGGYFGARYAGYMSDIARTAAAGEPASSVRDAYSHLYEVHQLLIDGLRPGVRACDVFESCRLAFEERKLPFRMPHVGHGIGISVHEHPMLNPQTTQELLPGMVLAVEPITMVNGFILHIEDMVEVTSDGARVLSGVDDWSTLRELGEDSPVPRV